MTERGVVACGHPITADVAVEVLRAGGNAVDALVAASFASFVCEMPLTGIGGGGYMMIRHPARGVELLDFFVAAPGLGLAGGDVALGFDNVDIDFGPARQTFHIGYGSAAVPGNPAGMVTAHARWGRIPLADLVAPAQRLAREGFTLTRWNAMMLQVLAPIVTYGPDIAALFAPGGRLLREGERLAIPDLAGVFDAIAREGHDGFYRGPIADAILDAVSGGGGRMSRDDLAGYRTAVLAPLETTYRGHRIALTPPPSVGGTLIALSLAILERTDLTGVARGSLEWLRTLMEAMAATNRIRAERFPRDGIDASCFGALVASLDEDLARHDDPQRRRRSAGNTTHLAVVDGEGMVASCSNSYGEGCGHIVPGTGIELNNMLGEEDLNPHGFHLHRPGARLPSMMCPLVVETRDGGLVTLGSGGSNRIRTALLQVLVNALDGGEDLARAIAAPRIHWENGTLHAEPARDPGVLDALAGEGVAVERWPAPNLFFGGVHGVSRDPGGHLDGAGDLRRFGVFRRA